ncbi:serine hydrolase domain-containing protein [Rufibacter latericius]|uniref:Class A beta-lactamase-related serine hydrolase n=1 Tax=Rufibacter latericius TaxID=2487040 RepID=A0A3M9MQ80_9BACT|nr:serine hydrolase domain-containing protein [Rufibacter latericius]RNI26858.1 class A beta-lactamase-related serine hydrolase [Rufibacter latericius]
MNASLSRITLSLIFCFLFCTASFGQKTPRKEAELALQQAMADYHIPGLAFAVVKDGKVIHQGQMGFANLAWKAPVDQETVFQTASCSKLFTALLLGKLFDEKILRPDQTMGELFDSIPYYWKPITVKQLAAHQSGIWIGNVFAGKTPKEAFELAKENEMTYEPGTQSFYVSADYWILQHLIEKKTGKPFYAALKQYVLEPLGMKHTFVNNGQEDPNTHIRTADVLPKEATVYAYHGDRYQVSDMQFGATGYTSGGIYTSIEDMAKIAQTLDQGTFLTPATQALLVNGLPLKDGKKGPFGVGFVSDTYQGHKVSGHTGGPALADYIRFDDQKLTFIVLANQRGFYPLLARTLATYYIPGLQKPELPKGFVLK